jgi:hypothetical protein
MPLRKFVEVFEVLEAVRAVQRVRKRNEAVERGRR